MTIDQCIDDVSNARAASSTIPPIAAARPATASPSRSPARRAIRGAMRHLPLATARDIYRRLYWQRPGFDRVAERAPRVAAELFDTGVNMGPAVAAGFLQRALNALNRGASDYPDLVPDGRVGPATLAALDRFLALRPAGEGVLVKATEALQGERYLALPNAARPTRPSLLRLAGEPHRIVASAHFPPPFDPECEP